MRRATALLTVLALTLAGCLAAPGAEEQQRPRATLPGSPGELPEQWMFDSLPAEPVPFDVLEAEAHALKASPRVQLRVEGQSAQGRPLLGLTITEGQAEGKPTVMLTGSQHGNEPSGSDAAMLLAAHYAWGDDGAQAVLQEVNIHILLCANPDGREADTRGNADEVDVNRDHMNLATVEGQTIHRAYHRMDPAVVLDLHQFGSPPVDVPPTPLSSDIIFEVASVQNPLAYPGIVAASHALEARIVEAVQARFGTGSASSYPPTASGFDSSIHRNHYGMHNSLSLLFEARRGLADYETEVALQIVAAQAVLRAVAEDPVGVLAAKAEAEGEADSSPLMPPHRAYLVPPQGSLAQVQALLQAHGLTIAARAGDFQEPAVHYGPAAGPGLLRSSFPNGTLEAPLHQADWRHVLELFESSSAKDEHYTAGPRDAGVEAWRGMAT